jgi:cell wall-associated NlpC family hydrolase
VIATTWARRGCPAGDHALNHRAPPADSHKVRRLTVFLAAAVVAATLTLTASARAATAGSWNRGEQRTVAAAGLLARLDDGRFHGERALTGAQLGGALSAVAARDGQPVVAASAGATVSVTDFDARLVTQLGLADVAAHVQNVARGAGLQPPKTFGTEAVARFLGLRTDHPAADETLELYPWDPITRAEAAHSLAVVLGAGGWALQGARAQLGALTLPAYTGPTQRALSLAASKIGMPYVWGGETDDTSNALYGYQAHGGYDCSGLVWRVFKLSGDPAGNGIGGRTAAQMAGEIPKRDRVRFADIRPGDLLFFGPASFHSKATARGIVHVGIALSPHWMIQSSGQGVDIASLDDGWRRDEFAWARRVL